MSGLSATPARVLISEAVLRFGAEETAWRLGGLPSAGELLALALDSNALRPREHNWTRLEP
jgi:hypothetical protein